MQYGQYLFQYNVTKKSMILSDEENGAMSQSSLLKGPENVLLHSN